MRTDYDYYVMGCRHWEMVPLSRWRFTVAYAAYQRMLKWAMTDWQNLTPKRRPRIVARWNRSRSLDALVRCGKDLAARAWNGDDDAGTAGAGDREPRIPLTPLLSGCGARPLPAADFVSRPELWS